MMIHPDFQRAQARERSATLLAAAAAHRRARLRDDPAVLIRPVRRTGATLLAAGFARLSERSRRLRLLRRKNPLTETGLRYHTDAGHEALGHARGGGVGIARYVRDRENPDAAEIALTTADG